MPQEIIESPSPEGRAVLYLCLVTVFAIWGSLYVASKYVLGVVPPLTVSCLRYVVASAALLPMLMRGPRLHVEGKDRLHFLFIGAFGYFLSMGAQMLGTQYAGASMASLINSTNPVAIMLVAAMVLKEGLTLRKVACIALAMVGTYTILGGVRDSGHILGILLSAFSVLTWAFVSVDLRRMTQKYDPIKVTAFSILIGMACTLPFAFLELRRAPHIHLTLGSLAVLVYMGLVCTALAHILWNKCLSRLEASTCSLFYPIMPMVSAGLGVLLLGEALHRSFFIGGAIIVAGVVISMTGGISRRTSIATEAV